MTWSARQLAGQCCRAGCPLMAAAGMNYCSPHRDDQLRRTRHRMRVVRAARLGPLFTWAVQR